MHDIIYSQEAEDALVGAALVNPDVVDFATVDPDDFYIIRNKAIWRTLAEMRQSEKAIDVVTLQAELERTKRAKDVGKLTDVVGLMSGTFYTMNAGEYAEIVRDKARRRRMLEIAGRIATAAANENANPDDVITASIEKLSSSGAVAGGAVHWGKYLSELFDEVQSRIDKPTEFSGIRTGFSDLDKVTGGLQQSELWLMSGEPGVGKSILAMQMAAQLAESAPGALYSIEMKGVQVMRRLVSAKAKARVSDMKKGTLTDQQYHEFIGAIEALEKLPVYMSDDTGWTTATLRNDLMRLKVKHGVRWFVLDYLYLLNDGMGQKETERTGMISVGLKRLCRSLDIGGVVIHSMNKTGMAAGVPQQEHLRGSGQVTYDADLIMFMTDFQEMPGDDVPFQDQANLRNIYFGKGRELEDPRKYLYLVKQPGNYPAFVDYSWRRDEPQQKQSNGKAKAFPF